MLPIPNQYKSYDYLSRYNYLPTLHTLTQLESYVLPFATALTSITKKISRSNIYNPLVMIWRPAPDSEAEEKISFFTIHVMDKTAAATIYFAKSHNDMAF